MCTLCFLTSRSVAVSFCFHPDGRVGPSVQSLQKVEEQGDPSPFGFAVSGALESISVALKTNLVAALKCSDDQDFLELFLDQDFSLAPKWVKI